MPKRVTLAVVALLGVLTLATLWAGDFLTRPSHAITGAPDPGLPVRTIAFDSRSGVRLSAWYIPGVSGSGAVLLLHGIRSNKRAMLPRARFLHASGFGVLLVDLQAHGESGGNRTTFGYREAADVDASVRKLRELAPGERVGILGVSLGAASAVFSDVQPPPAAIVLESLYPTIEEAVENRLRMRLGVAGPWLSPLLLWQLRARLGVHPVQLRPIEHVARLESPVLLVHGSEDRHTTIAEAGRLFEAMPTPKEFHAIPGAAHVDLHRHGGREYERRIADFLGRHLRAAG